MHKNAKIKEWFLSDDELRSELNLNAVQAHKFFLLLEILKHDRKNAKLDPLTQYRLDEFVKSLERN